MTADRQRFPELADANFQVCLVRLKGRLYRYSIGEEVLIHRQEEGSEIFVPCGC